MCGRREAPAAANVCHVPAAICPNFGREWLRATHCWPRAAVAIDWALSRLLCFDHLTHEWFTPTMHGKTPFPLKICQV